MTPPLDPAGQKLWKRVQALVDRGAEASGDATSIGALALELFAWQRTQCRSIDRVARVFLGARTVQDLDDIPGVPTDAFKATRICCFEEHRAVRIFRTSGTTLDVKGEHLLLDTTLYAKAALESARLHLLPLGAYRFILLAGNESEAPESSLSFMLARFAERFACQSDSNPWMVRKGELAVDRCKRAFEDAERDGSPVALLGATFAFVHLADALGDWRVQLPKGSVVMPTGGFKGRSRELSPAELFQLIGRQFGVPRTAIVQEYGMTELSSQAYEAHALGLPAGVYVAPPWMMVTPMDPNTLRPVPLETPGILRIIDLANVSSCIAIQTADLGVTRAGGFEVLGRVPGATPRGCARALDAVLSGVT